MTKIVMQKMAKIVAVSVMSAIVSVSFNGCWFFGSSTGEIRAESCSGEGMVTMRGNLHYGYDNNKSVATRDTGECKNGLKEGLWKYYAVNDSSMILQEVNFVGGIRNGTTKSYYNSISGEVYRYATIEYYNNGKKIGKRDENNFYLYEEDFKTSRIQFTRWRKYNISLNEYKRAYYEKVSEIEEKNRQIENENYQANYKYEEAKAQAQEIAKQRAESKVKKPTMQEVKKSKNAMDTYRAKLQAQVEKELQIELSKTQAPQVKQTLATPQYKEPKLDTYEEILAFVKDKKYIIEEKLKDKDYLLVNYTIDISQDSDGNNFRGKFLTRSINCTIGNNTYKGTQCEYLRYRYKDTFWDKTIFKDKLNAILPND